MRVTAYRVARTSQQRRPLANGGETKTTTDRRSAQQCRPLVNVVKLTCAGRRLLHINSWAS